MRGGGFVLALERVGGAPQHIGDALHRHRHALFLLVDQRFGGVAHLLAEPADLALCRGARRRGLRADLARRLRRLLLHRVEPVPHAPGAKPAAPPSRHIVALGHAFAPAKSAQACRVPPFAI
jgi:hypothetical protein